MLRERLHGTSARVVLLSLKLLMCTFMQMQTRRWRRNSEARIFIAYMQVLLSSAPFKVVLRLSCHRVLRSHLLLLLRLLLTSYYYRHSLYSRKRSFAPAAVPAQVRQDHAPFLRLELDVQPLSATRCDER